MLFRLILLTVCHQAVDNFTEMYPMSATAKSQIISLSGHQHVSQEAVIFHI